MKIKDEMKPKEENVNYAGESYIENVVVEKEKKMKKDVDNKRIDKMEKCIKDKDSRILSLEKRLNDRVKYYYTAGVFILFSLLLTAVLYVAFTDTEAFNKAMIFIGMVASAVGCLIFIAIFMILIWDDESDKEEKQKNDIIVT